MNETHRAIDRDLPVEEAQTPARFPEAAADARLLGRLPVAEPPFREIRSGGDPDQRLNPFGPEQRYVQRKPRTHRRADEKQRPFGELVDDGEAFLEPQCERAVFERAAARSRARI